MFSKRKRFGSPIVKINLFFGCKASKYTREKHVATFHFVMFYICAYQNNHAYGHELRLRYAGLGSFKYQTGLNLLTSCATTASIALYYNLKK